MSRTILLVAKGADRLLSLVILGFATVSGTAIFLMAILMAANVISRQVFDSPFLDTVLLGELSIVIMTYMGIAWVYRIGRHVSVYFLVDRLPWKTRAWIKVIGLSVSLAGIAVAIDSTWFFAHASLRFGERLRGIFRVDAFPFHVLMPIGLSLLGLVVVRTIVLDLTALVKGNPELSESAQERDRYSD